MLNQYQRRADLVPNLVNTVKGYASQEKDVLTRVTEARAQVGSIRATPELLADPQAFAKFEAAQGQLTSSLSRLLVVSENYPQLKSDANFRDLQAQLEGTENRIAVARNRYIKSVQDYNTTVSAPIRTPRESGQGYGTYGAARNGARRGRVALSSVVVFDTDMSRVVGRITNVNSVHGVLAVPQLGRVYAPATGTNEVVVIDPATLAITARIPADVYPDGMAYASDAHSLYVSDETGGTSTVIDVASNQRVGTILLGGEAGNTQYDPVSKHIFVNVQTRSQLVEIDPASGKVVALIDVTGAKGNHGLLVDADQRLAFIACEGNDRLVVLDMRTMRVSSRLMSEKTRTSLRTTPHSICYMSPARQASSRCFG